MDRICKYCLSIARYCLPYPALLPTISHSAYCPVSNLVVVIVLIYRVISDERVAPGIQQVVSAAPRVSLLILAARKHQDFGVADWLGQIILPGFTYPLILITGLCFVVNQPLVAFARAWLATIWLLVCAIYNTWSLVVWIIMQRNS